jgi:hypothetical protein
MLIQNMTIGVRDTSPCEIRTRASDPDSNVFATPSYADAKDTEYIQQWRLRSLFTSPLY